MTDLVSNQCHDNINLTLAPWNVITCTNDVTIAYWFNYTNKKLVSVRTAGGKCNGFGDFIVQWNKISRTQQKISKGCARITEFFAYVISQKRRANQLKSFQSNVSQVKRSPHAKCQLFFSTFKNGQKIWGRSCLQPFNLLPKIYNS